MAEQDPEFAFDIQGESLGGSFGQGMDSFEDSLLQTPQRSPSISNDVSPTGHRQSLAFELAQASPSNPGSSLAAELGLEDSETIEEEDYYDDEDDPEELIFHQPQPSENSAAVAAIHATPPRQSKVSVASTSASSPIGKQVDARPEADFEALDAELAKSAQAIQADLDAMQRFLANLSTYTSDVPSTITPASKTADRQLFLERLTSDIIRSMYSAAKERDAQLREVHELSRQISRAEPDWIEALAEVEPLPVVEWQVFMGPADAKDQSAGTLHNIQEEEHGTQDQSEDVFRSRPSSLSRRQGVPSSRGSTAEPKSGPSSTPTIQSNGMSTPANSQRGSSPYLHGSMASLRRQTGDLITSLSGINEHVQVHKASLTEAGRKLKSIKSALANIKAESDAMDECMAFVQSWEALHGKESAKENKSFAQSARVEAQNVQAALEEASRQAHALLSDPA